jgi:hypothetical protein
MDPNTEHRKLKWVTQTINKGGAKIMSLAQLLHWNQRRCDRGNIGQNTHNKEKQNKILENRLHGQQQNTIPCTKVKHHNFVGTIFFVFS